MPNGWSCIGGSLGVPVGGVNVASCHGPARTGCTKHSSLEPIEPCTRRARVTAQAHCEDRTW